MADNEQTGTAKAVATDKVTYSGDADQNVQLVRQAHVTGSEGSKTVQDVSQSTGSAVPSAVVFVGGTDGTNARALKTDSSGELQVDVLTLPNVTLAAGTNTNEVVGDAAHDAGVAGNPLLMGGVSSAAAPTSVDADGDAVRAWYLRNGAQATVITAAGALIGGDATNGLDVDITRGPASSTVNSTSSDGGTALTNSAQAIKASAGVLTGVYIYNPNATAVFVQVYNTAAASVTVGTTNPLFMLTVPPAVAVGPPIPNVTFGTAISWSATSTAGGNGAPTTALDAVAWYI